jgi:TonB family protein
MHYRRFLLFVLAFQAISLLGSAQEVITVDKLTLNQHITHRVSPVYPSIAKAARVQGTVDFEVRIGVTGKIESMKVVSGPAMLQQAAMDCLKQWTYRPFEKDGVPVAASGPVSIAVSLGKDGPAPDDEKIAARYLPAAEECKKAMSAGTDYKEAIPACKNAAEIADEFAPNRRFIERRSSYVSAAMAFAGGGDLNSALVWAAKAVKVVKQGHDDDSGNNEAYSTKGTIEGMMGNLTAADRDLTLAEDFERKGVVKAEKEASSLAEDYKRILVRNLRFHALVLQRLNRQEEARKKLDEAAKYY